MTTYSITTAEIGIAIADSFRVIEGLHVEAFNELGDAIQTTPTLQVYWQRYRENEQSTLDRVTSKKGVIHTVDEFYCDCYAKTRGVSLASDMTATMQWLDKCRAILEENKEIYFGLTRPDGQSFIKWMRHRAERGRMQYTSTQSEYAGFRITLEIGVF